MYNVVASAGNSILDSNVLDFIVDGITDVVGIMTTPPLGTFITIGIVGAVIGLALKLKRGVTR